jgi:NIPSNAP
MMYVQASIKLRPGKLQDFISLLNDITPFIGKHGWKLLGSYAGVVARLNTVVDLWEVPNADAVTAALADPDFQKWAPRINEIIEDEVLTILTKLPIG